MIVKSKLTSGKGFYVGDICYVLDDEIYDGIWAHHNYDDGEFETPYGKFAVASTAYGDGLYPDDCGHEYGVDAGVIGIVPWEILEKQKKYMRDIIDGETAIDKLNVCGHFFESATAEFEATGRTPGEIHGQYDIMFDNGSIHIDTVGWDDEYDDDDYDEDDDEDYDTGYGEDY